MNILRSALTGAITVPILFAICWAGAAMGLTQIHMFVSLFTAQAVGSVGALIEGVLWSLVFGAGTGAILAVVYNALGFLQRR